MCFCIVIFHISAPQSRQAVLKLLLIYPTQGKKSLPEYKWTHYLLPWERFPVENASWTNTMSHDVADLHSMAHQHGHLTSVSQTGTGPQTTSSTNQYFYVLPIRFWFPFPQSTETSFLKNSTFLCILLGLLQNISILEILSFSGLVKMYMLIIFIYPWLFLFCPFGHMFILFLPLE